MIHETKFEWINGIENSDRIYQFLNEIDAIMIPSLSERVCIGEYAWKLACRAETLFIVQNDIDIASCSVYCNSEIAYISSIAVKKEFSKQHVGTTLLDEVKRHVKVKKCVGIQLEVYSENLIALKLYEKNGFIAVTNEENPIKMECLF